MNKRRFLKSALIAGITGTQVPTSLLSSSPGTTEEERGNTKWQHWIWIRPNAGDSEAEIQTRYIAYKDAGVKGIFFEADSERHFRLAKKHKLEAHRWMWIMNRGEKELLSSHPEWYAVSRTGKSCATEPPYVGYYRWLCPSRDEVLMYLEKQVRESLDKEYVDGIHLDYIRYCDVILPVNLWDKYKIVQDRELPEYDFCYCAVCRNKFKKEKGVDPMDIQYPDQSLSWRKFRYDAISRVVNHLSSVAKSKRKPITAAVFPTPEVAKRIVRQDWTNWKLDAICPMIYHGFYKEDVQWIGDAVAEGVNSLQGKFPLYAGLYLPDFNSNDEIKTGFAVAKANGAAGISLFGNVTPEVLELLKKS